MLTSFAICGHWQQKKLKSIGFKDWSSNSHVALIVPYSLAYFDGLHQTSQIEHITFLCAHALKGTPPKIQNPLCKEGLQVHSELYPVYLVTPHVVRRDCVCVCVFETDLMFHDEHSVHLDAEETLIMYR